MPETPRPKPMLGKTTPRRWPRPLRRLTPRTSHGFAVARFAEERLGEPLRPWQRWLAIHGMELTAGGRYRFPHVLALTGRGAGKSHLLRTVALWRMVEHGARVLGAAYNARDIAKVLFEATAEAALALDDGALVATLRHTNGAERLELTNGASYRIVAANRSAARGLHVDLLLADEIMAARDWAGHVALLPTIAVATEAGHGQMLGISSGPDDDSAVLLALLDASDVATFDWSATAGCRIDDRKAWMQANPGAGYGGTGEATLVTSLGSGMSEQDFRREHLGQRVPAPGAVLEATTWAARADRHNTLVEPTWLCFDARGPRVTVAAASTVDGRSHAEVVGEWLEGDDVAGELAALVDEHDAAKRVYYLRSGEALAFGRELRRVGAQPVRATDEPEVCQSFVTVVRERHLTHDGHPRVAAQVEAARRTRAARWTFDRAVEAGAESLFAVAGAVWLSRTQRVRKIPKGKLILPSRAA